MDELEQEKLNYFQFIEYPLSNTHIILITFHQYSMHSANERCANAK